MNVDPERRRRPDTGSALQRLNYEYARWKHQQVTAIMLGGNYALNSTTNPPPTRVARFDLRQMSSLGLRVILP